MNTIVLVGQQQQQQQGIVLVGHVEKKRDLHAVEEDL